ncbi:hypothetical protein BGZ76_001809 [Entomortierella beljakovae]|nr:hypothetical protein BGZ76_001809 [Entomortierella beljakovae]
MSASTSQIVDWTFFAELLPKCPQQCNSQQTNISDSKVRKIIDLESSLPPPPRKRRMMEGNSVTVEVDTRENIPIDNSQLTILSKNKSDWILVKKWYESIGTVSIDRVCHHISDNRITIKYQEGSILVMLQDLILAVRPDDPGDLSWSELTNLYAHLKPTASIEPPPGIQPPLLIPQLLPFQKRSVAWCLMRECGVVNELGQVEYKQPSFSEKLPLSWEQICSPTGLKLLINRPCGLICKEILSLVEKEPEPRGGILAEEMGLGKTVEMLALILLNRRKFISTSQNDTESLEEQLSAAHINDSNNSDSDMDTGNESNHLIKSGATLIITPPSILHQWASEIEVHAPTLNVFIYIENSHEIVTPRQLAMYDIVLTTYHTISKEVNFTSHYDRPRRYERQYTPRRSPFIAIDWWRVCLDEAQMIEGSNVSQAATMALMIPRVMSWAISGTPIRRSIEDLQSLLRFLNQEPLASNKRLWRLLTTYNFRSTFVSCYQKIMHRYAKRDVAQELALPPQRRMTYGIHFSEIERANYSEKWEECLADCNVDDAYGNNAEVERLQSWFMRLRQICCHPQIGTKNKESLGKTNLRTVDEVLDVMIQQNITQMYIKERAQFVVMAKRAVLRARINKDISEMDLFKRLIDEAAYNANVWKIKYDELQARKSRGTQRQGTENDKGKEVRRESPDDDDEDRLAIEITGKVKGGADDALGTALARQREWLEQHHRILFFAAGLYHDLEMEEEETEYYKLAEDVRQSILAFLEQRFNRRLTIIKDSLVDVTLNAGYVIPASEFEGGIVMWRHLEQLDFVRKLLNQQLDILSQWRGDLVKRLTQPLMQDGEEGEQYQYSIDLQHTLESYLHFYGRMVLFRKDLVSGTHEAVAQHVTNLENQRQREAMAKRRENRVRKFKRKSNGEEEQKEEELDVRLEREMNQLITPDLVSTIRSIRAGIRSIASDNSKPAEERKMAEAEDLRLKNEQTRQMKLALDLEKEIIDFRSLTATRTAYYRQLQAISDTVQDIESIDPENDILDCIEEENKIQLDVVRLVSKRRYLDHLASTNQKEIQSDEDQLCLICRSQYDLGLMTECGHVFCEHCLLEWTKRHSKCPSCNSLISRKKLSRVTMSNLNKEHENIPLIPDETVGESSTLSITAQDKGHQISNLLLVPETIRRIAITDGFGSKIDSIVRHIVYLVREDPNTKCLVFSQWSNLLQLLGDSLINNGIGFVRLDGSSTKTAVKQFREQQDKHVFMLHAKSQSAGLTLLSATHIFICEPLLNPVLQAQAVSRVHRIGQTKETFVHYYLVNNTVEIPCFDLFEQKQAAVSGASSNDPYDVDSHHPKEASASTNNPRPMDIDVELESDTAITASEISKAQNRNGELVKIEDLKHCFRVQRNMNLQIEA